MKIIKNFSIFLISLITVFPFYAMEKSSWSSRMYKKASNVAAQAKQKFYSSRLAAGYHSTPQEKEAAYKNIRELLFEKDQLQDLINSADANATDRQNAKNRIRQIDLEIHRQKIITGDKWSNTRKLVWGGLTLGAGAAGATALYSYYTPTNITPPTPTEPEAPTNPKTPASKKVAKSKIPKDHYTPATMPSLVQGTIADKDYTINFSQELADAPNNSIYAQIASNPTVIYDWTSHGNVKAEIPNRTNKNMLTITSGSRIPDYYYLFKQQPGTPITILRYYPESRKVEFILEP